MTGPLKKWLLFVFKLAIAVGGLWWVIAHTSWDDQAAVAAGQKINEVEFLENVPVAIVDQASSPIPVPPSAINVRFDQRPHRLRINGQDLVAPVSDPRIGLPLERPIARSMLVTVKDSSEPEIQVGLRRLLVQTDLALLAASWAILLIPFTVTAWRWKKLMEPQGIAMPYSKCLALTFVGQFYSTFLPGTVSGDVIKIIYTSRVTGSRTISAVTVLLDRVIGLVALMVIAGTAAAFQAGQNATARLVLLFILAALGGLALFSVVYFSHRFRQRTGLQALLNRPWVPEFVRKGDTVLHVYRRAWRTLLLAFAAGLVAQLAIPVSAWLAGRALHIQNAAFSDYLAYTPLAILAASVPISFLGLGIMDSVLLNFFCRYRNLATASQAFALAQAIRFLPVLWNLVGAYWVVTGTYSRQQALDQEKAPQPVPAPPA